MEASKEVTGEMKLREYLEEKYQERPWYEKYNTVTLYHGTTWERAQQIKKEGLKLPNVEQEIYDTLKKFNIKRDQVPDWVTSEIGHRRGLSRIYLTNSRDLARRYATGGASAFGGEAISNTVRKIMKHQGWDEKKIQKYLRPESLKYGIVVVDMPWEEAQIHNRKLAHMVQTFKKVYGENWREEAAQQEIEFFSEKPIPKKYIVRVERI